MSWLICIGGGIASGKTTLAKALKEALPDSVRLAFGDVVRLRALAEGRRVAGGDRTRRRPQIRT